MEGGGVFVRFLRYRIELFRNKWVKYAVNYDNVVKVGQ